MIKLQISNLRKAHGLTQQKLADLLNVSFQTISKWENGITLPDITVLPELSRIFGVSTDELLGLKPLKNEYVPAKTSDAAYWDSRLSYLQRTRNEFWNVDYLQFLVEKVWRIHQPVNILDCGCGCGTLGQLLLPILPPGSSYTGVDFSDELIQAGIKFYKDEGLNGCFVKADLNTWEASFKYDLVISQALLRHVNNGKELLEKMIRFTAPGGLTVSIETNREFEADGLYIDGLDYAGLCRHSALERLWETELKIQGRDYSIAMKIPFFMKEMGLENIGSRMNDKITGLFPDLNNYEQSLKDTIMRSHWCDEKNEEELEEMISYMMNHGADRAEAEDYCRRQNSIAKYIGQQKQNVSLAQFNGMIISYGWKTR